MIRLFFILLTCIPLLSTAQLTNNGNFSISENAILTINDAVINRGTLTLEGAGNFTGNISNQNEWLAEKGTVALLGSNQEISSTSSLSLGQLIVNGSGSITLTPHVTVLRQLTLQSGRLNVDTLLISGGAVVTQSSFESFVEGTLVQTGTDSLYYPIGSNGVFKPLAFSDIVTDQPVAVKYDQGVFSGEAGRGLLSVSDSGYWEIGGTEGLIGKVHAYTDSAPVSTSALAFSVVGSNTFTQAGLAIGLPWVSSRLAIGSGRITFGTYFDEQLRVNDSLQLVSLYNTTEGNQWLNSANWLSGALDDWAGIVVRDKRVAGISLPSNQIQKTIDFSGEGLEALKTLDIHSNEVTSISGWKDTGLESTDISDNKLQFGTIEEALTNVQEVRYEDQKPVLDSVRVLNEIGSTYALDRQISGSNNTYQWFRNDQNVDSVGAQLSIPINSFADEAVYYAEVTNALVPDLRLTTQPVSVLVSSIERDSSALITIYNKMNGDSWQGNSNWKGLPIAQWTEIELENNRVTGVDLAAHQLAGRFPFDITDLSELESLDISKNRITGIPVLTSLERLAEVDLSDNLLQFGDLQRNATIVDVMTYAPQKPFGNPRTIQYDVGQPGELSFAVGGVGNTYQWQKDGMALAEANNPLLQVPIVDYASMGDYVLTASNETLPDLTLVSHPQKVEAVSEINVIPFFTDFTGESKRLEDGEAYLFRVRAAGQPYDSVASVVVTSEGVAFEQVVLDDYILQVTTALSFEEFIDGQEATLDVLPTYFSSSIDWIEADTIELRAAFSDTMAMERLVTGLETGTGTVDLLVESEFAEESLNGRIEARRKVRRAGCSLRRNRTVSGGKLDNEDEEWLLVAYQETDDQGEVNFGFLPRGLYRLNIQYPGIPMDPNSFIEFEISEEEENSGYQLNALITEEAITVSLQEILSLSKEYFEELKVYPVPASQEVNIHYQSLKRGEVSARLVDLNGQTYSEKELRPGEEQTVTIDVSQIADGIYLIHVEDRSRASSPLITYKVIVRHD